MPVKTGIDRNNYTYFSRSFRTTSVGTDMYQVCITGHQGHRNTCGTSTLDIPLITFKWSQTQSEYRMLSNAASGAASR